ncbi:MAG: 1-acyl-sn-glycerol-3-phosphate acyltransferase [Pirellulales bacterium]|nr:1-acyl-sn-glycerol-3-phosphate acyltransferase [Pirellulales bacterium]
MPANGPVLLVANHQSNLDPVLIGVGCRRRLCFVAKKSLFFGLFGWSIRYLDAIPLDQEGSSLSGIRGALQRLKQGKAVLIFPEGSRTPDGQIAPIQPGFCGLARRSGASILPLGVAGAFEAWPRTHLFPRPNRVAIQFGEPISADTVRRLGNDALVELVQAQMIHYFERASHLRRRSLRGWGRNRT